MHGEWKRTWEREVKTVSTFSPLCKSLITKWVWLTDCFCPAKGSRLYEMIRQPLHMKHTERVKCECNVCFGSASSFQSILVILVRNSFSITNGLDLCYGWDNLHVLACVREIVKSFLTVSPGQVSRLASLSYRERAKEDTSTPTSSVKNTHCSLKSKTAVISTVSCHSLH